MMYVIAGFAIWALGWLLNVYLANGKLSDHWTMNIGIPFIFGLTILLVWECFVIGFEVNPVFLPRPSDIIVRMANEVPRLWADFFQTIIKGALTGYIIGGLAAFGIVSYLLAALWRLCPSLGSHRFSSNGSAVIGNPKRLLSL